MLILATNSLVIAAAKSTTTTNTAGSYVFLIVIAVVFFVVYRYFMKPRQRAAQMQRDTLIALEPGDEVLTGAGIFGTVQQIQGDRVTLWTGTGSTITVLRRTIARKLEDDDADYDADDEHESSDHDSSDHNSSGHDSWIDDEAPSHDAPGALDGSHGDGAGDPEPATDSLGEDEDR
jgi:preprotein translocase subunit YajC